MSGYVPMVDLASQYAQVRSAVQAAIERVVESQQFILGPEVEALESELANYVGTRFAVGVSSGTDALLVSLMSLGVGFGDEVITTPYSFIATASSIARLRATVVFVDIDPLTFNLDAAQLERRITARTKAIVPVHLFGQMADMSTILAIADRNGVPIIEDAAQAIGAERDGRSAGAAGALGCLSFFPTKNLGGFGDGGLVLSDDAARVELIRRLRSHGQASKNVATDLGGNFRLDALQAAVLRAKLPFLDDWTRARRRKAAIYRQLFESAGFDPTAERPSHDTPVVLPREALPARHVYNQFVLRVQRRDELRTFLAENGVASEIYYPRPLHLQGWFASHEARPQSFPNAERAAAETLAIPIYAELDAAIQERVVATVARFYGRYGSSKT